MPALKVMIIRHGEKPDKNRKLRGVTEAGKNDAEDLIVRGWQRAGALVRLFAPLRGHSIGAGLATPKALFAPIPNALDSSDRASHTVGPLATLLDLNINSAYGVGDEKRLAKAVLEEKGPVLIAWEHKHVKKIVAHLTGKTVKSPRWPKTRFDMVLVLTSSPKWTLQQIPQMVLPGDSAERF